MTTCSTRKGEKQRPGSRIWLLLLAAILFLTGCSDFVDSDQPHVSPEMALTLEPGHPVGQTFVARHGGLNGIMFWLDPEPGTTGRLLLHLRADPQASADLATATLPLDHVKAAGFYRFTFPPDPDSHGVYRYAFLEMEGSGAVRVGAAPGEAYIDGAAYRDYEPQDAQLAFRLTYDVPGMVLELARAAVAGVGLLAVAALLYLVPGYAMLAWLLPASVPAAGETEGAEALPWPARVGLAAGVSLALYPLLLLWTDLVGLHLGPLYAWGPAILGLAALAWRYRRWRPQQGWAILRRWACSEAFWPDMAFIVIITLVFGVRLLVVRTLDAPMWGDSYQHTMIAQLLADHGGLFDSWEPYTPYRGLTVHFGFPAATALLSWATGIDVIRSTLLTGQLLNGLAILALYPLAVRLAGGNRWAGVGAVLVAGLLSPMPAYYVNWGRFAQLAGQAVLPVALWLLWESVERERFALGPFLLAGLVLGGMVLHYYRMPFYYVTFVLAWLAAWGMPKWKADRHRWLTVATRMALVAAIAFLFVVPWGLQVADSRLAGVVEAGMSGQSRLERVWRRVLADYRVWRDITWYVPWPLLGGTLLALLWSLWRREKTVLVCLLWTASLSAIVAGQLVRLPGANMMQSFAVLIALYIPVGLAWGWLTGEIAKWLGQWGATAFVLVLALLGTVREQINVVDTRFALVTRPDVQAMAWIRQNTPPDARFLVEGFRIYGGRSAVGADAGWWIPLLAGRENTMPPQYALLNEVPAEPDYSQRVVDLVAHLEKYSPGSPEGLALLCSWGITHVYIGQGQGKVGAGAAQLFSPKDFVNSSDFQLVYHRDRVWVFTLSPGACGEAVP